MDLSHPFANIPKAMAAGKYPIKVGAPARNAFLTSSFILPNYH
jgi:hypothetical protein